MIVFRGLMVALVGASAAYAEPMRGRVDVPVMVGGLPDIDACNRSGTVVGLDPRGDGFLSVRSGPGGAKYREIDRVHNGMQVAVCDEVGPWFAVVYSHDRDAECEVGSPRARRQAYTGPCLYGWVHSRYIGNMAG